MSSVTKRIKQIKQPYGGYVKPRDFQVITFEDHEVLYEENIHSSLVGLAVDYLTRFMLGTPVEQAFQISLLGARIIGEEKKSLNLLSKINSLDVDSIYSACKLVGYDVCFRAGATKYKDVNSINADQNTINNIRLMVNRSLHFFDKYGPVVRDGFDFEGGYTQIIQAGDGDFLTQDTLWDFKVSSNKPTSAHTLQLLIYYIMGLHSIHPEFKNIKKLGIYNPRTNTIYIKNISEISSDIIEEVSTSVIGYTDSVEKNASTILQTSTNLTEDEDILFMPEIMKRLNCSRYTIMKYYSEKGLPMYKEKGKYAIKKCDLDSWIEQRQRQQSAAFIPLIAVAILIIIALIGMFSFPSLSI